MVSDWQAILTQNSTEFRRTALRQAIHENRFLDSKSLEYSIGDKAHNLIQGITDIVKAGFVELSDFINKLTNLFTENKLDNEKFSQFKTNFATLIADTNRFERILGDQNLVNARNIQIPGDTKDEEFTVAAESLMGRGRMFSNNSDAYYCAGLNKPIDKTKAPVLLALVADGVTGNGIEKDSAAGKLAAKALTDYLRDHEAELSDKASWHSIFNSKKLKQKFSTYSQLSALKSEITIGDLFRFILNDKSKYQGLILNNYEQLIKTDLKSTSKIRDLYLHFLGYQTFEKSEKLHLRCLNNGRLLAPKEEELGKFRKTGETLPRLTKNDLGPVDLRKIENEAEKFFAKKSLEFILRLALIDAAKPALNTLKVITDATENIAELSKQAGLKIHQGLNPSTTLSLALNVDDKVLLLSTGDTTACAFNEQGIIANTVNSVHVNKFDGTLTAAVPAAFWSESLASEKKFHITQVDKKDIRGLILASDGAIENDIYWQADGKNNWDHSEMKKQNQEIFANGPKDKFDPRRIMKAAFLTMANKSRDDKTMVVLSKGHHLAI